MNVNRGGGECLQGGREHAPSQPGPLRDGALGNWGSKQWGSRRFPQSCQGLRLENRGAAGEGCDLLLRTLLTQECCAHLWVHWSIWGNDQRPKEYVTLARSASMVRCWTQGRRWARTPLLVHHPLLQRRLHGPLPPPPGHGSRKDLALVYSGQRPANGWKLALETKICHYMQTNWYYFGKGTNHCSLFACCSQTLLPRAAQAAGGLVLLGAQCSWCLGQGPGRGGLRKNWKPRWVTGRTLGASHKEWSQWWK